MAAFSTSTGEELTPGRHAGARGGSMPASCKMPRTVDAEILWPSLVSSPCTRRWPQLGLSVAIRITSVLIGALIGRRPGRRGAVVCLRAINPRCHANSVPGVTGKTSAHRRRGMSAHSAANQSRSCVR